MERFLREKIYIDLSKHELFKNLSSEGGPFLSMKDVFMAAAVLGFNLEIRTPVASKKDIFNRGVFDEHDIAILYAIFIAYYGDVGNVTLDPLMLAEEFANAGVDELNRLVTNSGEGLVNLVEEVLIKHS